jgi:hypothetical protein
MRKSKNNGRALPGFFPELAIETAVECAVDLEERVEVAVTELAVVISDVVCDHQEELERELGGRHRHRIGVQRNANWYNVRWSDSACDAACTINNSGISTERRTHGRVPVEFKPLKVKAALGSA